MKDRAPADLDDEAAEAAMRIVQHPRAPVVARRERDLQRPVLVGLPVVQLVDAAEAEVVHEIADFERHDDRLIVGDLAQRLAIEMIEVRVRHEHEVDVRQIVQMQPRMPHALDHLQPLRPVRIDEQVLPLRLDQKRGVADPGDADFAVLQRRPLGFRMLAGAFREDRRQPHLGEEVSPMPSVRWLQSDLRRFLFLGRRRIRSICLHTLIDRGLGFAVATKGVGHGAGV